MTAASTGPVVIFDYDPDWPVRFERLREALVPALADLVVSIEHVGSTAVPGLAAKPIIDVDLVVDIPVAVPAVIDRLSGLGYEHLGDLGIPGREAFRAPLPSRLDEASSLRIAHHLYVVCGDSAELTHHVAFRDALQCDAALAQEYAELKRRLAATLGHDRDAYAEGKTEFVNSVLDRAPAT